MFRFNIMLLQIKQQWEWAKRYHNLCTVPILHVHVMMIKWYVLVFSSLFMSIGNTMCVSPHGIV